MVARSRLDRLALVGQDRPRSPRRPRASAPLRRRSAARRPAPDGRRRKQRRSGGSMRRRRSSQSWSSCTAWERMFFSRIAGRGRPIDAAQHQKAAIEPRREQMNEIVVDHRELVAPMIHGVEELLAHAHPRPGAIGCEIAAAEQFEPPRLAGDVKVGCRRVGRRFPPRGDGADRCGRGRARRWWQASRKGDARPGGQLCVERRGSPAPAPRRRPRRGRKAAPRRAPTGPAERSLRRLAALTLDEGAAPFGDALQHFAEKGGVHRILPIRPARIS